MRSTTRVGASCLAVSIAVLAVGAPASAAPKRIKGKLSKPGYTVIALAANGDARTVVAPNGGFTLVPPARAVTLHLRAPDATYAGPVVLAARSQMKRARANATRAKRATLGVRAGARLGRVRVRRGYAKVARTVRRKWLDARRVARARKGVPIGARVFGRVLSKPVRAATPGDFDADGIPEPLDVDDDGDLRLDEFDPASGARAAQAPLPFSATFNLSVPREQTVNANAAGLSGADIDAALQGPGGNLSIALPGEPAELDCGRPQDRFDPTVGGLFYCSAGGSGRVGSRPFPGPPRDGCCFDLDGDGFGSLVPDPPGQSSTMFLDPGARSDQIGTGDILVALLTNGEILSTLGFVYATVPALASYDDDGPGGKDPTPVGYPADPGDPGTGGNGFAISPRSQPCPDPSFCEAGDVVLTLTFWRPQRRPIGTGPNRETCLKDTPPCEWIDIGNMRYGAGVEGGQGACPEQGAFSTEDPNLTPKTPVSPGGFRDLAPDRPADPTNTFTYTLNVTRCLAAAGASWTSGERGFAFKGFAAGSSGFAEHSVVFRLP